MQTTIYILLAIIVVLMWILIYGAVKRSKNKGIIKNIDSPELKYYCMKPRIDDLNYKIESLHREIESLTRKEAYIERQALRAKLEPEFIAKIGILRNCYNRILNTNDIEVLYLQKQTADKIIGRLIGMDYVSGYSDEISPDDDYMLNNFKYIFNNMICRVASHKLTSYQRKYHELKMEYAKQMHTQKIFIDLDTLKVMVDMDVDNYEETLNALREQYTQVEKLSNYLMNY